MHGGSRNEIGVVKRLTQALVTAEYEWCSSERCKLKKVSLGNYSNIIKV